MNADIEALVLSGELFNGPPRSSSPERSPSPDAGWHDDEMLPEARERMENGFDYDSDGERRAIYKAQESRDESIGMGPGRTGVKGVIRDRAEAEGLQREKKAREVDEMQKLMEKSHLGGKTFLEEEREKAALGLEGKLDRLVIKEQDAEQRRKDVFGRKKEGRFGHLREVGVKGFVDAVEKEERGIWVVVHIYEPSLERCYVVDETLARLARLFPDTKFLRARASALEFASSHKPPRPARRLEKRGNDDDDDSYSDDNEEDDSEDESNVDLDMLPTMLVYRDGELVHNWVRVDWEVDQADIEELLDRHHILPQSESILGATHNLGLPSDDEDDFDLLWSDDEDINNR
ncbi:thioredoxin-like protein [Collybia nuda]|uniref:Thioredoxin-like protein n=1 Tax=Collybia nuda TaxID=64659 RepID=A0A9P5YKI4_9AGAR|nr:thioredoxin-like protein [Collybia nuda]